MNIDGVKYTFSGAPAHQMTAWNGRNALTAVRHLFDNVDAMRSNLRPEARIQGIITEGGAAPNVVPDRAQADFYIRYPDEVYLRQVREAVDNAARAAALATGTKVKIDNYGNLRDGISTATLAEVAFAFMKQYGAGKVSPDPGKPQGYEESGSVSRDIPGIGFSAYTSDWPNHTYEMDQDNLKPVGHAGFTVQAQAMAALLHEFATRADYRAAVAREFGGIKTLFGEYLAALDKVYQVPAVPDPGSPGAAHVHRHAHLHHGLPAQLLQHVRAARHRGGRPGAAHRAAPRQPRHAPRRVPEGPQLHRARVLERARSVPAAARRTDRRVPAHVVGRGPRRDRRPPHIGA